MKFVKVADSIAETRHKINSKTLDETKKAEKFLKCFWKIVKSGINEIDKLINI